METVSERNASTLISGGDNSHAYMAGQICDGANHMTTPNSSIYSANSDTSLNAHPIGTNYFQSSSTNTNTTMSPTSSPPSFLSPHHSAHHTAGPLYGSISNEPDEYSHHPSGVVIKMEYHEDYECGNNHNQSTVSSAATDNDTASPSSDFYSAAQIGSQFVSTTMLDLNSQQYNILSTGTDGELVQQSTSDTSHHTFYTTLQAGTPTLAILNNASSSNVSTTPNTTSSQNRSRSNSIVSASANKRQRCAQSNSVIPTSQSYLSGHSHHSQQQQLPLHLHTPMALILDSSTLNESQIDSHHHKMESSFQQQQQHHLALQSTSEMISENGQPKPSYQASIGSYYGDATAASLWQPTSTVSLAMSTANNATIKKELNNSSPPPPTQPANNSAGDGQTSPSAGEQHQHQMMVFERLLSSNLASQSNGSNSPTVSLDGQHHVQFHYHPSSYANSTNGN